MNFSCNFRDRIAEKVNQRSEVISQRLDKMVNECNLDQSQQQADVRYVLEESLQMSTRDTASKLLVFFTNKYPLQMWAAIVYDATQDHKINFAIFQFGVGGKNAIVEGRARGSRPLFTQSSDLDAFMTSNGKLAGFLFYFSPASLVFSKVEKIFPGNAGFGVMRSFDLWLEHDKDMTVILRKRRETVVVVVPLTEVS